MELSEADAEHQLPCAPDYCADSSRGWLPLAKSLLGPRDDWSRMEGSFEIEVTAQFPSDSPVEHHLFKAFPVVVKSGEAEPPVRICLFRLRSSAARPSERDLKFVASHAHAPFSKLSMMICIQSPACSNMMVLSVRIA